MVQLIWLVNRKQPQSTKDTEKNSALFAPLRSVKSNTTGLSHDAKASKRYQLDCSKEAANPTPVLNFWVVEVKSPLTLGASETAVR